MVAINEINLEPLGVTFPVGDVAMMLAQPFLDLQLTPPFACQAASRERLLACDSKAAPVTQAQVLAVRRFEDRADDLWTVTNRVQEALVRGGVDGRLANGRRAATRAVQGIDQNVKLNRALWVLATEMRRMKQ